MTAGSRSRIPRPISGITALRVDILASLPCRTVHDSLRFGPQPCKAPKGTSQSQGSKPSRILIHTEPGRAERRYSANATESMSAGRTTKKATGSARSTRKHALRMAEREGGDTKPSRPLHSDPNP